MYSVIDPVVNEAEAMLAEDVAINKAIGKFGRDAILAHATNGHHITVLTHCNTGIKTLYSAKAVILLLSLFFLLIW